MFPKMSSLALKKIINNSRIFLRYSSSSSSLSSREKFRSILQMNLDSIEAAGTYKSERIITSSQDTTIKVFGSNKEILNFCANNYLGLSNNEDVIEYSKSALEDYGAGLSSVRFICGTQNIHKTLEKKIAKFHQREDAILYSSCFDANAGIFETILTQEDAVFSDELNHASIIDGIRLCKAKKCRYQHNNLEELENQLKSTEGRIKLIATDGVFSMDGDITALPKICELAQKYNALVFVDECHATGFLGENGRGTEEYYGIMGKVDIINSTLGKALGGASGGYTTGPKELIELLRQKSRPYLFSNSLPPPVVAIGIKVFDILSNSSHLISKLRKNTKLFRDGMEEAGFNISGQDHPICPVMLGNARLTNEFAQRMLDHGIYVIGFSYPVVPKDKARIRVQISAAHSVEEIKHCIKVFTEVGCSLGVI